MGRPYIVSISGLMVLEALRFSIAERSMSYAVSLSYEMASTALLHRDVMQP